MQNKSEEFKRLPEKKIKPEKQEKKTKKNKLIKAINFLDEKYEFRFNVFASKVEYREKDKGDFVFMDERIYDNLHNEMKIDYDIELPLNDFRSLIGSEKVSRNYDPIREYLFALPNWDGVDRIPEFLQQVQLRDESFRSFLIEAFRKWFLRMVASLIDDEIVNENCLVFSGSQGRGKTRFFRTLVPAELRFNYTYEGAFNPRDKDHLEMLGTKILINLDEMATLTRTDIETLKGTMSAKSITLRRAYGRASIFLYRKASFCGSINYDEFLTDLTGNRRWLPFAVHNIDVNEDFNIGLLYAQAFALYKKGGIRTWFDLDEIQALEKHNEMFRKISPEEELILENFAIPTEDEILRDLVKYYTSSGLMHSLASRDEYRKMNTNDTVAQRIGRTLAKLGFKQTCKRIPGYEYAPKVWVVRELDRTESKKLLRGDIAADSDLLI